MGYIYSTGRLLYVFGSALLICSATLEFIVRSLIESRIVWPNPLPLLLYHSLLLFYSDTSRKVIRIILYAHALAAIATVLIGPLILGQPIAFPMTLVNLISAAACWYAAYRLYGFQRIFLLFKHADDLYRRDDK